MGYVDENLLPDERVIAEAKHHKAAFIRPAIFLGVGIILLAMDGAILGFLGFVLLLIGIWAGIKTAVIIATNEMALTSKRMIGKTGFVRRDSLDVRNNFVAGLAVNQSILGRALGYGEVVVRGGGGDVGFSYVKEPQKLRNKVQGYLADPA